MAEYRPGYICKLASYRKITPEFGLLKVKQSMLLRVSLLMVALLMVSGLPATAQGVKIKNQVAVFAALDKVTARISRLEVKLGETATFGSIMVTPRVCYSRPPTETPKTTAFVEVEEIKLDASRQKVFTGWMYAQSPGLHAVEHPVFDIWLTNCKTPVAAKSVRKRKKSPRRRRARSRRR